jgi:hypothetical protein
MIASSGSDPLLSNVLPPTRRSGLAPSFGLALRRGRPGLANLFGLVELIQRFLETVGNALAYHLVVNALKDVADSSLILAAEAPPGVSNLRVGMHL